MNKIKITDSSKTVLDSLREDFNIPIDALCGGNGTCGKCKIKIIQGKSKNIKNDDNSYLSREEIHKGYRLACNIIPDGEIYISTDFNPENAQILESHNGFTGILDTLVVKQYIELPKPELNDQRDDVSRLIDISGLDNRRISLQIRKEIPGILLEGDYCVTVSSTKDRIISIEPGNSELESFSVAFDLGTTTVVAYLLNNLTGKIIGTTSLLNSQKTFGADVISRIDYCINNNQGLDLLQKKIVTQLGSMVTSLMVNNVIDKKNIKSIAVAGNTTMLHLLAGIDPKGIATAPFIPGFLDTIYCLSTELGEFPIECDVILLPSISAYVGADIVAGVLATSMNKNSEMSLLVDLGTNGEIILGNKDQFYSCSTAAGPAFEGAHISRGIGAVSGAVNTFKISEEIGYTTINSGDAIGICGSAIVDIVSEFITYGIIDETGRFMYDDLLNDSRFLSEGEGAYIIVPGDRSQNTMDITFTQKDIREVQLAKASIAAGIETLLYESGLKREDVKNLYIAGGFGNYIDKDSSTNIGLIPKDFLNRSTSVGNTAGLGAINCVLSRDNLKKCDDIIQKTKYIELSGSAYFQERYIEEMMF